MSKPCQRCPFRRLSLPGYLGASTPEAFMSATMGDAPMPCHLSIDYDDPQWKEKWLAVVEANILGTPPPREGPRFCRGAASFFANILKRSREPNRPPGKKDAKVFAKPAEFIAHHRSTGMKSWEEEDE